MTQDYLQNESNSFRSTFQQFDAINRSQKILTDAEVKTGVYGIAPKKGKTASAFVYMMEVE